MKPFNPHQLTVDALNNGATKFLIVIDGDGLKALKRPISSKQDEQDYIGVFSPFQVYDTCYLQ